MQIGDTEKMTEHGETDSSRAAETGSALAGDTAVHEEVQCGSSVIDGQTPLLLKGQCPPTCQLISNLLGLVLSEDWISSLDLVPPQEPWLGSVEVRAQTAGSELGPGDGETGWSTGVADGTSQFC